MSISSHLASSISSLPSRLISSISSHLFHLVSSCPISPHPSHLLHLVSSLPSHLISSISSHLILLVELESESLWSGRPSSKGVSHSGFYVGQQPLVGPLSNIGEHLAIKRTTRRSHVGKKINAKFQRLSDER